jgi:hypothetical protein
MKIKREQRWLALIALIVGGFSSMATAKTISQVAVSGWPHWTSGATWTNGVVPANDVDSVLINSNISTGNDYTLGVGQTITETGTGTWYYDNSTFDIFGSVDLNRTLQGTGGGGAAKNIILESGSAFSLGTGKFNVAHAGWTTTWIADAAGVTDLQAATADLTGSAAVIDLTDYDLDGSGSTVVIMTTDEGATTFGSVTLIAPTNLTYVADVDYAYNGNTQIALTNIAVYTGAAETSFEDPDPSVIEMGFILTSTLVTGSVDLVYISPAHVNLTVTISEETHLGSFSVLSATNQVLDPEDFETTIPLEFQFDNGVAALEDGQTATGLVTIAWSDEGAGDSGSFRVPISALAIPDFTPVVGISTFTGGDIGEGLDLSGSYLYTVNLGNPTAASQTVQGVDFFNVNSTADAVTYGPVNLAGNWESYNFGTNANDTALEEIMSNALLGWAPKLITVDADVTMGQKYELQMLFADGSAESNRNFNITIDGVDAVVGFEPQQGMAVTQPEVFGTIVTYTFYATADTMNIQLTGGAAPVIQAFTLKAAGVTENGTPYGWLEGYELVVDGDYEAAEQEDSDLDGLLNWEEYRCGTVPTDAASVLKLNSVSEGIAGEYAVAWQGVDGKRYNVLSTDNLVYPSWTTNAVDVPGVEPETVATQTVSTTAAFFVIELAE